MNHNQLKKILALIAVTIVLGGCGATRLTYKPTANPRVKVAMQSIRDQIFGQPEEKVPSQVEVTENTLKLVGNFRGKKFAGETSTEVVNFKTITDMVLNHGLQGGNHQFGSRDEWYTVTLVNQSTPLFTYFSPYKAYAEKFMDNVYTMTQHKPDPSRPIVLTQPSAHELQAQLKTDLELLGYLAVNPDAEKFAKAEPALLSKLASMKPSLSKEYADLGIFTNGLAVIYQSLGKYEQAEPLYLRSLAIKEKGHIEVTSILDNLTRLYIEQGRFDQAEIFGQRSLLTKGEENISVVPSLNNLSAINLARGRYEQAEQYNQRSLSVMEKAVLSGHLAELSAILKPTLSNPFANSPKGMADFANKAGEVVAVANLVITGIQLTGHILNLFNADKLGGSNKYEEIANTVALAEIYHAQGKYVEAELKSKKALEINKQTLSSDHSEVANSLNRLAKVYYAQGKYKDAEPLFIQALEINEKKLGHDHPTVAEGLNNLALLYAAQNQYEQAKPLFQRSLRSMNQSLNRWLWGAGEKTRQAYLQQQEAKRDLYLSFYSLTNSPEEAFYFSLTRKGLLLRVSSEISALAKQSGNRSHPIAQIH